MSRDKLDMKVRQIDARDMKVRQIDARISEISDLRRACLRTRDIVGFRRYCGELLDLHRDRALLWGYRMARKG